MTPASAVCLSNGKACGAPITANDRLCCPGSICGPWGNICQPGCRISGTAYRAGVPNPANSCQVCQPTTSTTAWTNLPNNTGCSDNNLCTQTDRCQGGTCIGSNPVACPSPDQCHTLGTCNPATGVCSNPNKAAGAACNDWNACTQTDTCQSGSCIGSSPVVCPAPPDACHLQAVCNTATGICPSSPNAPDGTLCSDGNLCTQTDSCWGGTCVGQNPVVCTADPCTDPCHVTGTCDPGTGACSHPDATNGTPCSDGDICTLDSCLNGVCTPSCPNPYDDHCTNNVQDCDELGVDCGGTCAAQCPPGPCTTPCAAVACIPGATVCGSDTGGLGVCTCAQTTEGTCFCTQDFFCAAAPPSCTSSSQCPSGTQCVPYCGCGGITVCANPCGTPIPFSFSSGPTALVKGK